MTDKYFTDEIIFNCGHKVHRTEINCPRCKFKEIETLVKLGEQAISLSEKAIEELKNEITQLKQAILELLEKKGVAISSYETIKRVVEENLPEDAKNNYEDWRGGLLK